MRPAAQALALLALAGCEQGGEADPRIAAPPARYRVAVTAVVRLADIGEVDRVCRQLGATRGQDQRVEACFEPSSRMIVLPAPWSMSPVRWVQVAVHEFGHAAGWPGDHPRE